MNKLYLFIFLLISFTVKGVTFSPHMKVSVLTCGEGEEMYSLFGHTAIRFNDSINNIDLVFNYGEFNFNTDNFYFKFIKGNLKYNLGVTPFGNFLEHYILEDRSVFEQVLNLSVDEKFFLFKKLEHTLSTDEKYYQYKFLDKNCTTITADVIKELSNEIYVPTVNLNRTYREVLNSYLEHNLGLKLIFNIPLGCKVEKKVEHIFMPKDLKNSLINGKKGKEKIISQSSFLYSPSKKTKSSSLAITIFILFLALVLIFLVKESYVIFYSIYGFFGFILIVFSFYSLHEELHFNYHVLLFNPLLLLFPFVKSKQYFLYLQISISICLLLFLLILIGKSHSIPMAFLLIPLSTILIRYFAKFFKYC